MNNRRTALRALAAACLPFATSRAMSQAQAYPSKPVRIVTPFSAGSGPDAALRLVAEQLSRKWRQPVIIDNKPGGSGFIAAGVLKQGSTDGHDLIQLDSNHITTHPHTFSKLPYDVGRDFAPLAMLLRTPFFIAVAADSPFKTIDDILAKARAKPNGVFYGSWFNGSSGHIGTLRLQAMTKTQMTHVAYRDLGALYNAVSTKELDWALGSVASAGALERGGRLRFIAVAAATRDPVYPDVPATSEIASVRGFDVNAWTGLFAPAGTPVAVQERIAADVAETMAKPEVLERYKVLGYEAPRLSPKAFTELIQRETASWRDVIVNANLKLD